MKVEVVAAWPDRIASRTLELPDAACVADAVAASGLAVDFPLAGLAVFGRRVSEATRLHDGDRVELLRALLIDPKQARRRRAQAAHTIKQKAR